MKKKEESLNALTTIYTEILQEIVHYSYEANNEGGKLMSACVPIITIFIGLNLFGDNLIEEHLLLTIVSVCVFFMFALYSIAQRSFEGHTYVALLRRQASILEHEINMLLGGEEGRYPILYNHEYISRYIAAEQPLDCKFFELINIRSSHITYCVFLLTPCIVFGIFLWLVLKKFWYIVIYSLCCLVIVFFSMKKSSNKYENKELIRTGYYDDIESYRKDRKKSERENSK